MIGIGSDHGGYLLKEKIIQYLHKEDIDVIDYGTYDENRTDYPIYAEKIGKAIINKDIDKGILICKSGHGMVITINKFKNVYGSICYSEDSVIRGRADDNINVLVLSSLDTNEELAYKIVDKFLNTEFKNGRYEDRMKLIRKIEDENMK